MSGWPGGREFSAFQPRHENARFHLGLLGAVLLIVAYGVYRARSSEKQLQVDPHAADEIENAKQR